MITKEEFFRCFPGSGYDRLNKWVDPVIVSMVEFQINTPKRIAAYLAQVGHESLSFIYSKEIASGKEYDTGKIAQSLGNTPEADGDGQRYKGRGPIQITGLANYKALTAAIGAKYGVDFVKNPELLETPLYGAMASAWFWKTKGLNELADVIVQDEDGNFPMFERITKRINGGLNGYNDRLSRWSFTKKILGVV